MSLSALDRVLAALGLCRYSRLTNAQATASRLAIAERHARVAQARNRAILHALPDLMFIQSAEGVYLDYCARDPKALLVPPEQFLGRNMPDVLPPDLASAFASCFRTAAASGQPVTYSYSLEIQSRLMHFEARIVKCDDGTFLSIVRDMTAEKDAETRLNTAVKGLTQRWRLMTLADLASSLARDLNQPLSAMLTNAQVALRWIDSDARQHDQIRGAIHDVIDDAHRAAAVIQEAQALFVVAEEPIRVSMNAVVRSAHAVAAIQFDDIGVAVEFELAEDLPPVHGRRIQLQQVVLQLLMNAADAMREMPAGERRRLVMRSGRQGRRVRVSVSDNGPGVAASNIEQVFEPLYTTKADGVGMGLPVSRSVVEAHGGTLWVERNEPSGTTFLITLPAWAE